MCEHRRARLSAARNLLPFIELGPLKLPTYGLMLCISILAGVQMAVSRAERHGLAPNFVYGAASVAALVAILGAKLTDWAVRGGGPIQLSTLLTGAGTFLGGFLLAWLAVVVMAYRARVSLWRLADSFAAPVALGVILVRLGCFGASCDYGKPTDAPWGVVFTNPVAAQFTGVPLGVRLHPSQLYESALGLLILIVLLTLERKPRPAGRLVMIFATMYAGGRFVLEFWRGDVDRGLWGAFSTSQWLSLVTLAVFWGLYVFTRKLEPVTARAQTGQRK